MTIIRSNSHENRSAALLVRIKTLNESPESSVFDQNDKSDTKYIVAVEDGHPIATCRLCPLNREAVMIDRIAVLPAYQNKGFKQIVVEAAEEWAVELGYKRMVMDKHMHVSFAKELGYCLLGNQAIKYV